MKRQKTTKTPSSSSSRSSRGTKTPSQQRLGPKKMPAQKVTKARTPSKPTKQAPAKRKRASTPESLSPDEEERAEYTCDCEKAPRGFGKYFKPQDYLLCRRCMRHQHIRCATDDSYSEEPGHPLCNICGVEEVKQSVKRTKRQAEKMRDAVRQKREEMRELYEVTLWNRYCALPNPENLHPYVVEATQTEYDEVEDKMLPLYNAPQPWLDEVIGRVDAMMDDAGPEMVSYCMQGAKGVKDPHEKLLIQWRELAVWCSNHGPYRGQREQLGVLAEVLGLQEKGTYAGHWIEHNEDGEDGGAGRDADYDDEIRYEDKEVQYKDDEAEYADERMREDADDASKPDEGQDKVAQLLQRLEGGPTQQKTSSYGKVDKEKEMQEQEEIKKRFDEMAKFYQQQEQEASSDAEGGDERAGLAFETPNKNAQASLRNDTPAEHQTTNGSIGNDLRGGVDYDAQEMDSSSDEEVERMRSD
ncbi:uncharacterized protein LTR77_003976 [Saxophila tyrrhenica]|uniref:Zinc finger PHD-type domain-containing protein n=1 Tax=Saxophila tyrrhenica TaxID=1690608 RepID=A0AAV9PFC3_9PEZI|nr:hypothetical protein LTR77_003976 [Saxophila tyrrhenica]